MPRKCLGHFSDFRSFGLIILFGLFFAETKVPLPYVTRKGVRVVRFRLFGQYAVSTWPHGLTVELAHY